MLPHNYQATLVSIWNSAALHSLKGKPCLDNFLNAMILYVM